MNFPQKNIIRFAAVMLLFFLCSLFSAEITNTSYSNFYTNNNQSLNLNSDLPIIKSPRDPNFKLHPDYKKYWKYRNLSIFYKTVSGFTWAFYSVWIRILLVNAYESNPVWVLSISCFSLIPLTPTFLNIYYSKKKYDFLANIIYDKVHYKSKIINSIIATQVISTLFWAGSSALVITGRYTDTYFNYTAIRYTNAMFGAIGYIIALNLNLTGIRLALSLKYFKNRKPAGNVFLGGSKKGIIAGYRMSF